MSKRSILIVDDEKDILKMLEYNLSKEGYAVFTAKTGEEGLEEARQRKPDLIVLDLMLPGIDGLEVCRILKSDVSLRHTPVLMLTAKNSDIDQVVGLEVGASDYLAKPFSIKVLTARIRNIFRVREAAAEPKSVVKVGDLVIDDERHKFTVKGREVALTKLEFRILSFLMRHPGKVFSRDKLLSSAWEGEAFVVDRTVDVHVKSIRRKLGRLRDRVETVRGSGYRFTEESQ